MNNTNRKCNQCNEIKPIENFTRYSCKGYSKQCDTCRKKEDDYNAYLNLNGLKLCSKCNKEKSINNFKKCNDKRARLKYKDGLYSYCTDCSYLYFQNYKKTPKQVKEYRLKNKERIRKYHNKRAVSRKFKTMVIVNNGRAKRDFNLDEKITAWDLWHLAHRQKLICPISGRKLTNDNISLDHKIALSQNGTNLINNIQLLDYEVNIMKNSHSQNDFLKLIELIYLHQNKIKQKNT